MFQPKEGGTSSGGGGSSSNKERKSSGFLSSFHKPNTHSGGSASSSSSTAGGGAKPLRNSSPVTVSNPDMRKSDQHHQRSKTPTSSKKEEKKKKNPHEQDVLELRIIERIKAGEVICPVMLAVLPAKNFTAQKLKLKEGPLPTFLLFPTLSFLFCFSSSLCCAAPTPFFLHSFPAHSFCFLNGTFALCFWFYFFQISFFNVYLLFCGFYTLFIIRKTLC